MDEFKKGIDFYSILGVSKDANDDDIKKAYRTIARKYHPDVNPNNTVAEEKFKAAATAYDVLSDKEKRARYDTFQSGTTARPRTRTYTSSASANDDLRDTIRNFHSSLPDDGPSIMDSINDMLGRKSTHPKTSSLEDKLKGEIVNRGGVDYKIVRRRDEETKKYVKDVYVVKPYLVNTPENAGGITIKVIYLTANYELGKEQYVPVPGTKKFTRRVRLGEKGIDGGAFLFDTMLVPPGSVEELKEQIRKYEEEKKKK